MAILNYIIWNGNPEIFTLPISFLNFTLTLRWYGLLFALGFLVSQQLLYYIYRTEGKSEKDVDTLTIYMVVATILGARLGHVFFYEPEIYLQDPIKILKVWQGGLASHGAAIAILIALFLYSRYFIRFHKTDVSLESKENKKEAKVDKKTTYGFFVTRRSLPGQSYFQVVDRIVILVALTGALIRLGNFMNSEIIGKPTDSAYGVVFARHITDSFLQEGLVEDLSYAKVDASPQNSNGNFLVKVLIDFKNGKTAEELEGYLNDRLSNLHRNPYYSGFVDQSVLMPYHLVKEDDGHYAAVTQMYMTPRHPAQLYESISCVALFLILFWIWHKYKASLPAGRLLGIFLIICFGLRFVFEYLKENQVDFEKDLPLNMGQILSIPLVLIGVIILIVSYRKADT